MPENELYNTNKSSYDKEFGIGYGHKYPDGHVIRFHHQILEYELKMTGGKILDYGCSTGTYLSYFEQNGYEPFGCDIIPLAVEKAKKSIPKYANNIHCTPYLPKLRDYFNEDFDLIISNQVLYYFNDKDLKYMISQFYDMLKPNGVFFATMMSPTCYYHDHIVSKVGEMSKVVVTGRLNGSQYINFKTEEQIIDIFKPFKKLHLGSYGSKIREDEGSTDHFIFVGLKK